jgi:carboxymethylenebutenolidase
MCHDDRAQPPFPPGAAATAHGEAVVLTAADGSRFSAYAAHPEHPARAQVAIFGDANGLGLFYIALALRFAEIGIEALAIDQYGRGAGLAPAGRDDAFDYQPHLQQVTLRGLLADSAAALAHLRSGAGSARATFTLGFCMGGALSFLNATADAGLAGAIGLYAFSGKAAFFDGGSFLDSAERITCPVLGLFGAADRVIPVSDVQLFDEKLDTAGVAHEITLYPGAPHGFFELGLEDYAVASADAWQRILHFIDAHTPHAGKGRQ